MNKILSTVITFGVLIVVLVGAFFVKNYIGSQAPVVENPEQVETTGIVAQTEQFTEENKDLNYQATLEYPQFSGMQNASAQNAVNADIKNFVDSELARFKGIIKCVHIPADPLSENPCELATGFQEFQIVNNKILSVSLFYYAYMQGAHGTTTLVFKNYDMATGNVVDWKTLFASGSNYQNIIATYARTQLINKEQDGYKVIVDEDWLNDGTKPSVDNYNTNVGFNKDGLVVVYQQYQVAAYAAGPQTVVVPYSELKNVISPNSLLAGVIQ